MKTCKNCQLLSCLQTLMHSLRISLYSLWMKTTGRNTVTVVAVAANTARPTSAVPSRAAQIPLPDFQPSENLPAGSAVAFPTDI